MIAAMTAKDSTRPAGTARRFSTLRTVAALMLREMSTTYGRSPGGYVWAVLEPAAMILVLSVAFSVILRAPSLGTSFILFYTTGYIPFRLYGVLAQVTMNSMSFSRALLRYPGVTFVDAILARFALNLMTQVMVAYIILGAILTLEDTRAILSFDEIAGALALAALLGLGIGVLNCLLVGLFPLWRTVWNIVSRPLFLLSGVFYILEDLPRVAQEILWWNPLIHVTGIMRTGFYASYDATYVSVPFVLGCALVPMAAGLLLLRRTHRHIVNAE